MRAWAGLPLSLVLVGSGLGCAKDGEADDTAAEGGEQGTDSADSGASRHAAVNGTCAPHGERFTDQYDCATVEGPAPTDHSGDGASSQVTDPDETRLADEDTDWTQAELAACSCVCCHSDNGIGGYVWSFEFSPFWPDSIADDTLRTFTNSGPGTGPDLSADTSDAADNNGFSRAQIGVPTTDAERFLAFIDRERARRGLE